MLRGMPHPDDPTTPAVRTDFATGSTAYRSRPGRVHRGKKYTTTFWINPGITTRRLHRRLQRNPEWLGGVQQVVLVVGGNDLREGATSADLLHDILALREEFGSIPVCVASVFPQAQGSGFNQKVGSVNEALAVNLGQNFVRLSHKVCTRSSSPRPLPRCFRPDGIHLTPDTSSKIATSLHQYLCNFVC